MSLPPQSSASTNSATSPTYFQQFKGGDTEIAPYGCDSVTVNGYLGTDGVEPFLKECRNREKSLFMLVKTSNPSSGELQNRDMEGKPLYARMAEMVAKWGEGLDTPCGYNQIGAVVGATYPEAVSYTHLDVYKRQVQDYIRKHGKTA